MDTLRQATLEEATLAIAPWFATRPSVGEQRNWLDHLEGLFDENRVYCEGEEVRVIERNDEGQCVSYLLINWLLEDSDGADHDLSDEEVIALGEIGITA